MGILRSDVISHSQLSNGNASVLFDGTTDSITIPSHSAFAFGTADWTVEGWFYFTSLSGQQTLVGDTYGDTAGWYLYKQSNNKLGVYYSSSPTVSGNTLIETDRWYHFAFVRHSGRTSIYIDGELDAEAADTNNATVTQYYIGDTADQSSGEFFGNISNLRITRTAVYTTEFTVPKFKLKEIPGTILLCCQSSSSTTEAAVSVAGTLTANGDPTATAFGPGLKEDITDTGVVFDGVTTFDSLAYMVPPSGKTSERNRGRGLFAGGDAPIGFDISSIEIQSQGNAADFGDLTSGRLGAGAVGSSTRGVISSGYTQPSNDNINIIDFVTIANRSNATDFGDSTQARHESGASSSQTRGLFGGGTSPSLVDTIDFVTIATAGNATDFGNLTVSRRNVTGVSSPTRSVFMGGRTSGDTASDVLDFVTIASTGDATDFGNLTAARGRGASVCSSTRGIMCGGETPTAVNTIDFITIASAGNATDFGDCISIVSQGAGGASNKTRGAFCVGYVAPAYTNAIQFVTIATTGNSVDFGDNTVAGGRSYGFSDSHGGLS